MRRRESDIGAATGRAHGILHTQPVRLHQTRSIIVAAPMPEAMQSVASPIALS